jgi:hypothetical protein
LGFLRSRTLVAPSRLRNAVHMCNCVTDVEGKVKLHIVDLAVFTYDLPGF